MQNPRRLMLLCGGWLLATVCGILLWGAVAHAESGRGACPSCPACECPVCPTVQKINIPTKVVGIPPKAEIPADAGTSPCNPSQFYTVDESPGSCIDPPPNYKKLWKCIPKTEEFVAYLASKPACSTGFTVWQPSPHHYQCAGPTGAPVGFTCLEGYSYNGWFFQNKSSGITYYACLSNLPLCGPDATTGGSVCCASF